MSASVTPAGSSSDSLARIAITLSCITISWTSAVRATGVGSIAVVRALVNAPDPEAAATLLKERFSTYP